MDMMPTLSFRWLVTDSESTLATHKDRVLQRDWEGMMSVTVSDLLEVCRAVLVLIDDSRNDPEEAADDNVTTADVRLGLLRAKIEQQLIAAISKAESSSNP